MLHYTIHFVKRPVNPVSTYGTQRGVRFDTAGHCWVSIDTGHSAGKRRVELLQVDTLAVLNMLGLMKEMGGLAIPVPSTSPRFQTPLLSGQMGTSRSFFKA